VPENGAHDDPLVRAYEELEQARAEVERLRQAMSQALVALQVRQMVTAERVLRGALDA
jgi:hypothetical protein